MTRKDYRLIASAIVAAKLPMAPRLRLIESFTASLKIYPNFKPEFFSAAALEEKKVQARHRQGE